MHVLQYNFRARNKHYNIRYYHDCKLAHLKLAIARAMSEKYLDVPPRQDSRKVHVLQYNFRARNKHYNIRYYHDCKLAHLKLAIARAMSEKLAYPRGRTLEKCTFYSIISGLGINIIISVTITTVSLPI